MGDLKPINHKQVNEFTLYLKATLILGEDVLVLISI